MQGTQGIVLDTESTGWGREDRLVEIALLPICLHSGQRQEGAWQTRLNPQRDVPAAAQAVHGLSAAQLAQAPCFAEVAPQVLQRLQGAVVIGHNVAFDLRLLDAELRRLGLPLASEVIAEAVCTLQLARRLNLRPATLDALCDRYQVSRQARSQHGARVDCELLAQVYPHLQREAQAYEERLAALLGWSLQAPCPAQAEDLAHAALALAQLQNRLEAERKRYLQALKRLADGRPLQGTDWRYAPSVVRR